MNKALLLRALNAYRVEFIGHSQSPYVEYMKEIEKIDATIKEVKQYRKTWRDYNLDTATG